MRQLADLVGISNPYLSQIERGLREPSEKVIDAIAQSVFESREAGDVAPKAQEFEGDRIGVVGHQQPIAEAVAPSRCVPAGDAGCRGVHVRDVSAVHRP